MLSLVQLEESFVQDFGQQVAEGVEKRSWRDGAGSATHPPESQGRKEHGKTGGLEIDQKVADGKEQTGEEQRPSHRRAPQSSLRWKTRLESRQQIPTKEDLFGNRNDENLRKCQEPESLGQDQVHSGDPWPARTDGRDSAQNPKARAKRTVEDEEAQDEGRPSHEQGEAEDAQTREDWVQRNPRRSIVKGLARKPSGHLWSDQKNACDHTVHDLPHEPDQTPNPIESSGDGDSDRKR